MQYITTTELRTKSSDLINALLAGYSVKLIHRSKPIAKIEPAPQLLTRPSNVALFEKAIRSFKLPRLSLRQARTRYSSHLRRKYGQRLSGR